MRLSDSHPSPFTAVQAALSEMGAHLDPKRVLFPRRTSPPGCSIFSPCRCPPSDMDPLPLPPSAHYLPRPQRAAKAAQACETCRIRKTRCDEQRPTCGLCRRLAIECTWREPPVAKKDRTMVHILDTLTRLETKFDSLASGNHPGSPDTSLSGRRAYRTILPNLSTRISRIDVGPDQKSPDIPQSYHHLSVPHEVILWPSIYLHLVNSGIDGVKDLQHVLQEGSAWFIKLSMADRAEKLLPNTGLPTGALHSLSVDQKDQRQTSIPSLSVQQIQDYAETYFNTFNVLSPILIKEEFMAETLVAAIETGFEYNDLGSVVVLLVCALGQLAIKGVFDQPIGSFQGTPSGFRGGAVEIPPGIELFNEARTRLGFVATQTSLQSVQVSLLLSAYYGATAYHLESWRSTSMASSACHVLIKSQSMDWQSHYGGLVKRAFWTCILNESFFHLDLDLPESGIQALEDFVPFLNFHEGKETPHQVNTSVDDLSLERHFLALTTLRRLNLRVHELNRDSSMSQSESPDDYEGPELSVVREIARQLESWRSLLPRRLQWHDSNRFDFPSGAGLASHRPNESLFSPDQGPIPIAFKDNLDLVLAQLRTRYYLVRFLLYRPFVHKALHFPELMTPEDTELCALAIKSALLWPMAMAPPKNKKRLAPCAFSWTQNFIALLLVLRMTTENACLRQICETHVNRDELETSVGLLLEWLRDSSQVDPIAEWSWKILEPLFNARG